MHKSKKTICISHQVTPRPSLNNLRRYCIVVGLFIRVSGQCDNIITITHSRHIAPSPRNIDVRRRSYASNSNTVVGSGFFFSPLAETRQSVVPKVTDGFFFIHRSNHGHIISNPSSTVFPRKPIGFLRGER